MNESHLIYKGNCLYEPYVEEKQGWK
jgi:hypothetical protein